MNFFEMLGNIKEDEIYRGNSGEFYVKLNTSGDLIYCDKFGTSQSDMGYQGLVVVNNYIKDSVKWEKVTYVSTEEAFKALLDGYTILKHVGPETYTGNITKSGNNVTGGTITFNSTNFDFAKWEIVRV